MPVTENNNFLWQFGHYFFCLLIFILFFFSCSKKKNKEFVGSKKNLFEIAKLKQAKYSDIPLPIGYDFIDFKDLEILNLFDQQNLNSENQKNKSSEFFCYKGSFPFERVIDYYCENMERYGWQINDLSNEYEGLIFCNKINRICVISVRREKNRKSNKNYIYLFVKNKLEDDVERKTDINFKKIRDIWDF
ncbi:hypothetical protein KAT08_00035 [Candidatus Babeliales bacterium]|nr:hypothetical protein [Candidatus Babeliales bacterium]